MSRAREAREMERGTPTLLAVLAHPCSLKCLCNFPKAQFDKQGDGDISIHIGCVVWSTPLCPAFAETRECLRV